MEEPKPKFKMGEIVFLITDPDQSQRIVTGYIIRPNLIIYYLSCGCTESTHYDMEIATDKNYKI